MRAIVTGLVGGVSGGAVVLAASVLGLGAERERAAAPETVAHDTPVQPSVPSPNSLLGVPSAQVPPTSDVAAVPTMPTMLQEPAGHLVELVQAVEAAEVLAEEYGPPAPVAAATDERAARPTVSAFAPIVTLPEPAFAKMPEPAPAIDSATEVRLAAQAAVIDEMHGVPASVASEPPIGAVVQDLPSPTVGHSSDPPAVPDMATEPPPAIPPSIAAPIRTFKLHVPKDLPKIDLGFSPTIEPLVTAPTTTILQTPRATEIAAAASARERTTISGIAGASARGRAAPVARPARTDPAPPAAAVTSADPNERAQESLQRASDAVKRLSRRMGGRFGR
jgi:hypothetical protein